jgi:sterol 3beta-glucosyltransferase/vancomycin aglycone glucosyltransferase
MRIGLQTWGSDGDIRPFIALAAGLRVAGHDVTLSITSVDGKCYSNLCHRFGIDVRHTDFQRPSQSGIREFGQEILQTQNPAKHLRTIVSRLLEPSDSAVENAARELCEQHDTVVGHSIIHALPANAAKHGCRYVSLQFQPGGLPTRYRPPPGVLDLGPMLNCLLWMVAGKVVDRIMVPRVNAVRARVGVPPIASFLRDASFSADLNLIAASPCLVPPQPDWQPVHKVCGYLDLPVGAHDELVPEEIEAFVRAGPPPVYMTVGSMLPVEQSEEVLTRTLVEAALAAGCRAIVQSSPLGLSGLPDDGRILRLTAAPHALVFPRCAAVVHHGGAGTTHSACRAGVPSIVIPYYLDQGGWAAALAAARVAPKPLRRESLTTARLSSRIAMVLADAGMKEQARELGAKMRSEDGVARAVACIERKA